MQQVVATVDGSGEMNTPNKLRILMITLLAASSIAGCDLVNMGPSGPLDGHHKDCQIGLDGKLDCNGPEIAVVVPQ